MSNQAQCPNCGGYKVTSRTIKLYKHKPMSTPERIGNSIGMMIPIVLTGGMWLLYKEEREKLFEGKTRAFAGEEYNLLAQYVDMNGLGQKVNRVPKYMCAHN